MCKNDEKTIETIFNEGYGSIPSYKDALNWILEKGTSEDLKAEGENLFNAVKKPRLDAAEGAEDFENNEDEEDFDEDEDYGWKPKYIGRTDEYYNEDPDDDDGVFNHSREWWTWSDESADDSCFAKEGPVYKLTEDGKNEFSLWLDADQVGYDRYDRRNPEWPKEHLSPEAEWEYLTNPNNGLSKKVR